MTNLGGAPPVQVRLAPEDEAVLVALSVGEDEVDELADDVFGAGVHQVEGALVVGLGEGVGVGELVESLAVHAHHDPAVGEEAVVQLVAAHGLVLAMGHGCGGREEAPCHRGRGAQEDSEESFAEGRHAHTRTVTVTDFGVGLVIPQFSSYLSAVDTKGNVDASLLLTRNTFL